METDEKEIDQNPAGEGPRILRSKVISSSAAKSFFNGMDRKKKMEVGLLFFLVPVFFYLVWTHLFFKPASASKALQHLKPDVKAISLIPGPPSEFERAAPKSLTLLEEKEAGEEWVRNPFSLVPVREKPETPQRPLLQGTLVSPNGEAYAILSNKIVKAGDETADNQIESVGDGFVILRTPEGDRVRLDTSI